MNRDLDIYERYSTFEGKEHFAEPCIEFVVSFRRSEWQRNKETGSNSELDN